jgi:hypothetical protein
MRPLTLLGVLFLTVLFWTGFSVPIQDSGGQLELERVDPVPGVKARAPGLMQLPKHQSAAAIARPGSLSLAFSTAQTAQRQGFSLRRETRYPSVCLSVPFCEEVNNFAATVTRFQAGSTQPVKLNVNIQFQNKSDEPVALGYLAGSAVATDEQGHQYAVDDSEIRDIGVIKSGAVEEPLVLHSGQTRDVPFSFVGPAGQESHGSTFVVQVIVRQIHSLQKGRLELGAATSLRFAGLSSDAVSPVWSQPKVERTTAEPQPEHCVGAVGPCYDAGPFTAVLLGLSQAKAGGGRHHSVRLNLAFKNWTSQDLILGYKGSTSSMTDNLSNAYTWGRPGTYDTSVEGMGIVVPGRAYEAKFRLTPGETRNAAFTLIRYNSGNHQIGKPFTFDTVIAELKAFPSPQQAEIVREYNLHFSDVAASGAGFTLPQSLPDSLMPWPRKKR